MQENLSNYKNLQADEEDLTIVGAVGEEKLRFKDRSYNPASFSGLGFKILRKNIVNSKNILSPSEIPANTIVEIRYNFDLNGASLTLPENVVLKFVGGSLKNGTLVGNETKIEAPLVKIFEENLQFSGNFSIDRIYAEWFGADSLFINSNHNDTEAVSSPIYNIPASVDALQDASTAFNRAFGLCIRSGGTVYALSRFYKIANTVSLPMKSHLHLQSDTVFAVYMQGRGLRVMEQNPDTSEIKELPQAAEPVFQIAPNKFFHTDTMAVAFDLFPQQTKITGRGTITLVKSRYTIACLIRGTGFHLLDMSYGSPEIDVRTVGDKPNTYAPDQRDLVGKGIPSNTLGTNQSYYWDKSAKTYYWKNGTTWSRLGDIGQADPKFNIGLRVDVGTGWNSGRLINPQIKIWHMFGWRGVELYTHDGGWFNEGTWQGTVSNLHGSYVSLFTNYDIINHDLSKVILQTDHTIQYDARIFQCIRAGNIVLGTVWDMDWVQAKCQYAFYLGKFTRLINLTTIDKYKYVKDHGENNIYNLKYDSAGTEPIISVGYHNVLKYRTPFNAFFQNLDLPNSLNQLGWFQGTTLISDPIKLDSIARANQNNTVNYPRLLFDEDTTTSIDVINTDNKLFFTSLFLSIRNPNIYSPYTKVREKGALIIEYVYDNYIERNPVAFDYPFYLAAYETSGGELENAETGPLKARPWYNLYRLKTSFMGHNNLGFGNMIQRIYIPIKQNVQSLPYLVFFANKAIAGASMQLINIKFISDSEGINPNAKYNVTYGSTANRPDAAPKGHVYFNETRGVPEINTGTSSQPNWVTLAVAP